MVIAYQPSFQELISKIDYSRLPFDCPARAAQRMRECYNKRIPYDPIDVFLVLGDQTKGVEMSPDPKQNLEKSIANYLNKLTLTFLKQRRQQ